MTLPARANRFFKLLQNSDLPAYVVLLAGLGVVYWRTLLPTVGTWGDSAKMQFLGKVLGTPHLSGTPLYLILNHVFVTYFPKGTLAFRANLLSAVFGLAALCFLLAALRLLGVRRSVALAACLTLGVGHTFWYWSLIAEVYTLNALFLCATLFFLLRWRSTRRDLDFYAACLVYALSFSNHLITLNLLPALAYLVWVTDRKTFVTPKKILLVGLFILIGMLPYGYIYWRTQDPTTPYLETSWPKFVAFLTSSQARDEAFFWGADLAARLPALGELLWREYYGVLLALAAWGFFQIRDRAARNALGIFALVQGYVSLHLSAREYSAYVLPLFVVLACFIAAGMEWLAARLLKHPAAVAALFVIPLALLLVNYRQVDQSERTLYARVTEKVLATVERDALILAPEYDYTCFYLYYLLGEGYAARNLHATRFDYANPGVVRAYLEGRAEIPLVAQRRSAPPGLRVYVMQPSDEILRQEGLDVRPTASRYIFEAALPSP